MDDSQCYINDNTRCAYNILNIQYPDGRLTYKYEILISVITSTANISKARHFINN